jgi:hypothetical protein
VLQVASAASTSELIISMLVLLKQKLDNESGEKFNGIMLWNPKIRYGVHKGPPLS